MSDLSRVSVSVIEGSVRLRLGIEPLILQPEDAGFWAQAFYYFGVVAEHGCLQPCEVGVIFNGKRSEVHFWPTPFGPPQEIETWFCEERLTLTGGDLQAVGLSLWSAMQEALRPPLPSELEVIGLVEEFLEIERRKQ